MKKFRVSLVRKSDSAMISMEVRATNEEGALALALQRLDSDIKNKAMGFTRQSVTTIVMEIL